MLVDDHNQTLWGVDVDYHYSNCSEKIIRLD